LLHIIIYDANLRKKAKETKLPCGSLLMANCGKTHIMLPGDWQNAIFGCFFVEKVKLDVNIKIINYLLLKLYYNRCERHLFFTFLQWLCYIDKCVPMA